VVMGLLVGEELELELELGVVVVGDEEDEDVVDCEEVVMVRSEVI
jgi:hypothetical protein